MLNSVTAFTPGYKAAALTTPGVRIDKPLLVEERKPVSPQESLDLSGLVSVASPTLVNEQPSVSTITEQPQERPAVPSTLTLELPSEVGAVEESSSEGPIQVMTRALEAKASSEANWSTGLESFMALPDEDKKAAGRQAFYTQAAMLPELADFKASLPEDQQPQFGKWLSSAQQSGAVDKTWLESMVTPWSESHSEQAYMAQMSGFADYAQEKLFEVAVEQGVGSMAEIQRGPREETLFNLVQQANSYVTDRGAYIDGAHKLFSSGQKELAQQVLDA